MQINEPAAKFHPIARAGALSKAANSDRAWRRAKMRLEEAIEDARAFSRAHDEAGKQTIAARRALEGVQMPQSLSVQVSAYLRFKDDLGEDIERQSIRDVTLKSEDEISRYAKDDQALSERLLRALNTWRARRAAVGGVSISRQSRGGSRRPCLDEGARSMRRRAPALAKDAISQPLRDQLENTYVAAAGL
jgi:hypothetical protein